MLIREIDISKYDKFNESYDLFQSSSLVLSRNYNYDSVKFLGLFDGEELIGTTHILLEKIPYFNKYMGTAIKGPYINFNDENIIKCFNQAMKEYLKLNNILFYRFDLSIANEFCDGEFNKIEEIEDFAYDKDIRIKLNSSSYINFDLGKLYMGRSPQVSMLVDLKDNETILKQLNRSVKRGIKLAKQAGVEVIKTNKTPKDIEEFYKLHELNAKKNNISVMDINYYKELLKCEDIDLYLVKINKDILLSYAKEKYESNPSNKNKNLLDLAENYNEDYILGHISGSYNNLAYDMFTGFDYTYKDLGVKEYLMETIFLNCLDKNIRYYDFWGIVGDKEATNDEMYPIYLFKKKFSNIIVKYPGFWDVTSNKFLYKIFIFIYKLRYKIKHK